MAEPENASLTVDLKLNDEVTPRLRAIQSEFGELLEVKPDRWAIAAAAWSIATFLLVLLVR